jgi:hypothetical protein
VKASPADIAEVRAALPFDLKDYRIVDSDIVRGIGGFWASLHYEALPGTKPSRNGLCDFVATALAAAGWARDSSPDSPYVLSREYEIEDDDLFFRRGPLAGDAEHVFYKLAVHTGEDGRVADIYFTKGW